MSGFSRHQLKKLATALEPSRIQQREQSGKTFSYIEGWFAIAEANRIFGYDGWDRETVHFERLFDRSRSDGTQCGYVARIRLRVRAQGDVVVVREGTGFGQAAAVTPGEAHELALKAAETDATKRALATFGGRFGLLLYDKDRLPTGRSAGARPAREPAMEAQAPSSVGPGYRLAAHDGTATVVRSAESFCSGLRQLIAAAHNRHTVRLLQSNNLHALARLRTEPHLRSSRGEHYADVLERLFERRVREFPGADDTEEAKSAVSQGAGPAPDEPAVVPAMAPSLDLPPQAAMLEAADAEAVNLEAENPAAPGASPVADDGAAATPLPATEPALPAGRSFVPVPAYPLAALARRLVPPACAQPDDGLQQIPPGEIASDPAVLPAALPTRRSQISGGFSVDKSTLMIPSERRLRSKAHLSLVSAKPCLVCEEQPCHAHHITFAQPRGLSQKVSDEFTVPLCVVHHNALHAAHNEAGWWRSLGIEPLAAALRLWAESVDA